MPVLCAASIFLKKSADMCFFICHWKGERDGIWTWHRVDNLFNWLPLAALMGKNIICMHGGIGLSINRIEQIENLQRPIAMEAGSVVPMDLMWSVFELLLLSDYYWKILVYYLLMSWFICLMLQGLIQLRMIAQRDSCRMYGVLVLLLLGLVSICNPPF